MRFWSGVLLLLSSVSWARGDAQPGVGTGSEGVNCRATDIELYDGGSAVGAGHIEQVVELRNRSQRSCTLLGPPLLVSFDEHGQRVAEPYGRNRGSSLFGEGDLRLVTVQPGEFAHFKVSMTSCNNGGDCVPFNKLQVMLPGDYVPLNVARSVADPMRISVTAVQAGADTEDGGWVPPVSAVSVAAGELAGLSLRLAVPPHPVEGFTAHFALHNEGVIPVQLASKRCALTEKLTNSAGTIMSAQQSCGKWMGALDSDGMLAPGAIATVDLHVAGEGGDDVRGKICRTGPWTAELEMVTDVGRVRFDQLPFEVKVAKCSDSDELDVAGAEAIHWAPVPLHGVRLGMLVQARGGSEPAWGRYFNGVEEPTFQVGDRIELRLFVDNMTDEPVRLNVRPAALRLLVTHVGQNVPPDLVAPSRERADGPGKEITVPPHTQKELGTRILNDNYELREGDYEIAVGPLNPAGAVVEANVLVGGRPLTEDAAMVKSLIKVVP
jgi:hypothetical protein